MKKIFKKLFASLLALALVITGFTIPVTSVQAEEAKTTAYISMADSAFAVQYWYDGNDYKGVKATTAEVTGYGTYTVALDFSGVDGGVCPDLGFMDVEIANGEAAYPNSYMNIDSVKINGKEVTLGKTYTSSDDGIATRTNLFNTWVTDIAAGRTADGDKTDVTSTPVTGADYTNVKTVEVTFTLGDGVEAFAAATDAAAVVATPLPAEGTTAYLSMADSAFAVQYWFDGKDYAPVVATNATVTGYGQYTCSLDFSGVDGGVCPDLGFMDVEIQGGEQYFPNSYMQIDSLKINGEDVTLGKTYTSSDDGKATRTNLFNTWVTEIKEGRTADGVLTDATATPVTGADYTKIKTVEVTFTIVAGDGSGVVAATTVAPVDLNGVYHAYLGLQTPAWSFRNAVDDATYGIATDYFTHITGWDADNNPVDKGGVFTDAEIAGNGVYSVSVKDFDLSSDFTDQQFYNLLFISTDIPNTGEITISNVNVIMDGKTVYTFDSGFIDPDSKDLLKILAANLWNADLANGELFYYALPTQSIELQFTVAGMAYDNPDAVAVEPVATTTTTETAAPVVEEKATGLSTGAIVGIVVAAVVVIGGAVVIVVLNKKKKAK